MINFKALSMKERMDNFKCKLVWLVECEQNYVEYMNNRSEYMVWIEDENFIELKSFLAHKYGLKGVSFWRKD
ncbi:hypothetical protein KQI42_18440 [Tissierella sp. MSJ-40]|uniref:Uncharacterized protein n=1 Tax=Tissierella simiarum TaxID=2841534 RepID=A0ABS6EB26_9FIRM|nr:hypothetical protein [Tissierella simiarum]MBU5439992.1 hypothetical protein [Tissierella simiarum]